MFLFIYLTNLLQSTSGTISFSDNIIVWGGLSVSLAFNIIISFLTALGVFKPENKKRIGGYLLVAGALIGGAYAFQTHVTDNMLFLQYVVGGALSGLLAVGNHSAVKNIRESFSK